MSLVSLLRTSAGLALCLLVAMPAFSQIGGNLGTIGPSKGEVVGIIAGAAAGLTVVGILVYRETHKHSSITGCLASGADALTLQNEKDKKAYTLSGDPSALKAGDRVTVRGKKSKDTSGRSYFQVEKLVKDYGACSQ